MRRRVARKVLKQLLERTADRIDAGGDLFPARGWNWRGGHRPQTIQRASRVEIRVLTRRARRAWPTVQRMLERVPVLGPLLFPPGGLQQ